MNPIAAIYRYLVFKIGDMRWIGFKNFPFVMTWDVTNPEILGDELLKAREVVRPGDVIVTRHEGFVDNKFIGGAMVHAMLYVGSDKIVEAVSDDEGGVREWHLLDAMHADKAVILRPAHLRPMEILDAISWARLIVGSEYDIYFGFDSESKKADFTADPVAAKKKWTFCCTEVPRFCYLDCVDKLELYRETNLKFLARMMRWFGLPVGGKMITADMYLESEFEITWASKGCTVEWFKSKGSSEKLLRRVELYWASKKK